MNRICIWLLAAASAVCLCMLPRTGTDAAKLLPAPITSTWAGDGVVTVEADNGAAGSGPTLAAALADMAECAEGTLFLDTAEHIVLLQSAGALLPAAAQQPQFRPAAKLYLARLPETVDVSQTPDLLPTLALLAAVRPQTTRFTGGGEFGRGAEIGISNQKMHARGPMGLEELTSCKYVIYGEGQVR